jgi:hypothetical protein
MNALQMHIQLEQDLQRIDSQIYDDYLAEEKDLVLNKMVKRFIDSKVRRDKDNGGFQIDQGDLDDLQYLIEKDVELPAFVDTVRGIAYCNLPSDYMYLLNDRTLAFTDCKDADKVAEVSDYENEYIAVYPFNESTKEEGNYYTSFTILGGDIVFSLTSYKTGGYPEKDQIFAVKEIALDALRSRRDNTIAGVYWEHYNGAYHPNSLIVVYKTISETGVYAVFIDGTQYTVIPTPVTGLKVASNEYNIETSNRLTKSEFLHEILGDNSYTGTDVDSPVSNLAKDKLYVYFNKRFIPSKILIDYIRIPRKIDVSLNKSCELTPNTHQRIVDLSVEYIKNVTEQAGYDLKLRDNLLRME